MKKLLLLVFVAFFSFEIIADITKISLKSARSVTAEVEEIFDNNNVVQVSVKFIPVTSLDPVNNEKMNLTISHFFIEQALSQFYKKEKSVNFSKCSLLSKTDREQYKYISYTIPNSAISDAIIKEMSYQKTLESGYSFFIDADMLTASELFQRDLRIAEALFLKDIQTNKDSNSIQKDINKAFNTLKEKIENQDDLLSVEKEEFINKLEKVRKYLLTKINPPKKTTASHDLSNIITKYVFRSDFESILISDKILLEHGGSKIVQLPNGKIVLIGVGSATVRNNSARGKIIMKKIAEQRALAALAEHNNSEVTSFSTLSDSTTTTSVNKNESSKSQQNITTITTIKAEAYFEKLETVGTWYSKDGDLFFLAKGCFIE